VIEHSTATGHSDAGIYVGQGEHITIRNSVAFANVVGIEISNSSHIKLLASDAYDNTAGILVALLPGRRITTLADILIAGNRAYDNNRPNFAEPGDLVGAVPAGAGILIVGADRTKVENNVVSGNDFIGIGVGSSVILALLAGVPAEALADIEPNPDGVRVRSNDARGNGTVSPLPLLGPADLLWDGSGEGNCWSDNLHDTTFPAILPACR
jgi:parallel beta-helix repeat protein